MTKLRIILTTVVLSISFMALPLFGLAYDSFPALAASMLQYGNATPTSPPFITRIEVDDQDASSGMVIVKRTEVGIRSWVLIHNQQGGGLGEQIGSAIVLFGETRDIVIPIDLDMATPVLYATLYADWGQREIYDPELDVQTTEHVAFDVTLPVQQGVEPEVAELPSPVPQQPTVIPLSPVSPTPVPGTALPSVGWWPLIVVMGLFAVLVGVITGVVIFLLLRRRSSGEPVSISDELNRLTERFRGGGKT